MRYKKKSMIVAPQPEATEAGADVLRDGGNAVDAGIACALVQGVVDPLMCGIAGFGSCGIYMPGKKFHGYIDAHAPAPLAARPDMWANLIEGEARDGYGFILRGRVNDIGYQSICAPANLQDVLRGAREHGALPWSQHRRAGDRLGRERLDRAPARPLLVDGRRRHGPRAEPRAHPTSRRRRARSTAGDDGSPKRVGDRVVEPRLRPDPARRSPRAAPTPSISARSPQAIAEDMKRERGAARRSRTCAAWTTSAQRAAVGQLSRLAASRATGRRAAA